ELHLGDGSHAHDGCTGAAADDSCLREGCVDDAPGAELLLEALGDLEGASVDADVLADHEHPPVAAHLDPEPVGDRLQVSQLRHLWWGVCRSSGDAKTPWVSSEVSGRGDSSARAMASLRTFLTPAAISSSSSSEKLALSRSQPRKRSIGSRLAHSSN